MSSVFLDLRTLSVVLMLITAILSGIMLFIWRSRDGRNRVVADSKNAAYKTTAIG
ncbi:MAG: hypothetical protein ACR2N3_18490 [Pyrinomonadaceae bacterium]